VKEYFKNMSSPWKYGIVTVLAVLGLSTLGSATAGISNSLYAQPKTNQATSLDDQVKGAQVPTFTPTPTEAPTPTLAPTNTPVPTLIPTRVYIAPTTPYVPPTQVPANQTNSQLDNNNSYTNVDGNQVHSPANTVDGSVPAGASAKCGDGTYSFSQHRSGTCSHHGGVAQWL
jgi:hypothetical protein